MPPAIPPAPFPAAHVASIFFVRAEANEISVDEALHSPTAISISASESLLLLLNTNPAR